MRNEEPEPCGSLIDRARQEYMKAHPETKAFVLMESDNTGHYKFLATGQDDNSLWYDFQTERSRLPPGSWHHIFWAGDYEEAPTTRVGILQPSFDGSAIVLPGDCVSVLPLRRNKQNP